MNPTPSELLTIQFYEWEQRGRGYYHFDFCVEIEPPYAPMEYRVPKQSDYMDDGISPNVFKKIGKLFTQNEPEQELEETEIIPTAFKSSLGLKGFSLSFNQGQEISHILSAEFINVLSYSTEPLSFEILGNAEAISIQIICCSQDEERIKTHITGYFPTIQIKDIEPKELGFNTEQTVGIADFGLSEEFMLPIATETNFSLDPLTPIISLCDSLGENEILLLQMIFKGVTAPWSRDILYSVSDGAGGSFFDDSPEMLNQAQEKISSPLFSVIMRMAVQGATEARTQYLGAELARNIVNVSTSSYNKLVPLSNEQYDYDTHLKNVYHRTSNRLGMILNTAELVTFAHYPNKSIVSNKLHADTGKTKLLPNICINQKYTLGINTHDGIERTAGISDDIFKKHITITGATGTGKTHLVKQLIQQDLQHENATFVIDAHGDLIQDVLENIPLDKKENVVLINVADQEYSFGFNIFNATTESEKIVLASDLASAFSESWISSGDRIQSVLQKTISTFIYSSKKVSLLDMKRFLLEQDFRNKVLATLDDPILQYYWQNEFPLVKRIELSPLLLRIDNFLQTKLLRNIFAQSDGIDFNALIREKKMVLIQLSVGLIGVENSKFLARLLIAKINQIAFSRQSLAVDKREPIHLYIDEAHSYANTSSIEQILSGARKYNLSLILVLQHYEQLQTEILNAVLTNTATQIYFRQSEKDAKRIVSGFSFFEVIDFLELDTGQALVRVNKRSQDFNLQTLPITKEVSSNESELCKDYIINTSRRNYAKTNEEVEIILQSFLPKGIKKESVSIETKPQKQTKEVEKNEKLKKEFKTTTKKDTPDVTDFEQQKENYLKQAEEHIEIRKHLATQNFVRSMGLQRGFKVTFEAPTANGRVDVELLKNDLRIAVEISVTNTVDYEVKNIKKCLAENYSLVFMISDDKEHLQKIQELALSSIDKKEHDKIHFFAPNELSLYLDATLPKTISKEKRVSGYRVKVNYKTDNDSIGKQKSITDIIMKALRKK